MLKIKNRGDPLAGIASILYFHSKSPVFTQNRTAGKLKLFSDEKAHFLLSSLSLFPFSFFLFPFSFFLFPLSLSPSSPLSSLSPLLLPSSSLSALFSLPLSAPTFSSSPSLPPRHRHFTPLFVTPFFCCGSSISFQHEPAHFSNTKDCDPVYRIPFRRLDTTLRADQSSRRPTLHPS